jgi:hypothetical protein
MIRTITGTHGVALTAQDAGTHLEQALEVVEHHLRNGYDVVGWDTNVNEHGSHVKLTIAAQVEDGQSDDDEVEETGEGSCGNGCGCA